LRGPLRGGRGVEKEGEGRGGKGMWRGPETKFVYPGARVLALGGPDRKTSDRRIQAGGVTV